MATAPKTAPKATAGKPASKPAAAGKTAPKAAPKAAAKAEPEPEVEEELILDIGSTIVFLGYGEGTEEADMVLAADTEYKIVDFSEPDADYPDGLPVVQCENPGFNAKKKEHPETNPRFIQVEVLPDEMELVASPEADAADADADADADAAAAEAEAAAAAEAEAAAAKGKGKGKTATKEAAPAAKPAAKTAAKPAAKAKSKDDEVEAQNEVAELGQEDPLIQELIDSGEDLISLAQEMEAKQGLCEYQLGGLLSVLQRNKGYLEVEGGEVYAEKGGFATFIKDFFNVDYRKAMYLIDIYNRFSQVSLEDGSAISDKIALIGWTKASKIAKHVAEDGSNAGELIALAEANTVADLSSALVEQTKVGGTRTDGEAVTRTTLRIRMFEDQGAFVMGVLETIKTQNNLEDISEAMYILAQDWSNANGGEADQQAAPAQKAGGKAAPAKTPARRSAVKA